MYISIKAYADKWNVSTDTVRRWIKSGKLKALKIGRLIRIDENALVGEPEEVETIPHISIKQRLRGVLE